MKKCTKCNKILPQRQFSKRQASSDGLQSQCKNCDKKYYGRCIEQQKARSRASYHKDPVKCRVYQKKWIKRLPEHRVWSAIKQRCFNSKNSGYKYYGGRGITICSRWLNSFEAFLQDMGKRPSSNHSIDRINNNGNYEPGNCKWSTMEEQNNNRRNNVK